MGDDVLYSGTVCRPRSRGRNLGHPAVARCRWRASSRCTTRAPRAWPRRWSPHLFEVPLPSDTILNVNVPDLPHERLGGLRARRGSAAVTRRETPSVRRARAGRDIYWIGAAGDINDDGPGTDFAAVAAGFVSITPLQIDLTRHDSLAPGRRVAGRPRLSAPTLRRPDVAGIGFTLAAHARSHGAAPARARHRARGAAAGARDGAPGTLFVDEAMATRAYEDVALPIGEGQTISQPWSVARMTELPARRGEEGGGRRHGERWRPRRECSRSAPVRATRRRCCRVWSTRCSRSSACAICSIARGGRFRALGYRNIRARGTATGGWGLARERAVRRDPRDRAAPETLPEPLLGQARGGRARR